jgi:hypothetical protein
MYKLFTTEKAIPLCLISILQAITLPAKNVSAAFDYVTISNRKE